MNEATSNYYTMYDVLDNHLDVVVVEPYQTKAIGIAKVRNHRLNAKLLAQICQAQIITEGYIYPKEIYQRRIQVPDRKQLVKNRLTLK